ncbi:MAG: hypothetical protein SFX73_04910 [Kofleriaceae bacterium]|nr:hypothetical protein [Kofleriaceae bacterium]
MLGLCLVVASILSVTALIDRQLGFRLLMGAAALGLVADFALTEAPRA